MSAIVQPSCWARIWRPLPHRAGRGGSSAGSASMLTRQLGAAVAVYARPARPRMPPFRRVFTENTLDDDRQEGRPVMQFVYLQSRSPMDIDRKAVGCH